MRLNFVTQVFQLYFGKDRMNFQKARSKLQITVSENRLNFFAI